MSLELVREVKAGLEASGVNLAGPCGAFEIVKRVAWKLGGGAGLLHKRPEQNGCSVEGERYAVDIVMYPDGRIFDCLIDAGGENGPLWHEGVALDPSLYRPAIQAIDLPTDPPLPNPVPDPDLAGRVAVLEAELDILKQEMADNEAELLRLLAGMIEAIQSLTKRLDAPIKTSRTWGHNHEVKL